MLNFRSLPNIHKHEDNWGMNQEAFESAKHIQDKEKLPQQLHPVRMSIKMRKLNSIDQNFAIAIMPL